MERDMGEASQDVFVAFSYFISEQMFGLHAEHVGWKIQPITAAHSLRGSLPSWGTPLKQSWILDCCRKEFQGKEE